MKEFMKSAIEIIGGVLMISFVFLLVWLFLIATPDQYSAECEYIREEMHKSID